MDNERKTRVIINANQKGGVGKTTSTTSEAIIASLPNVEFNNKVCLIDWDIQANATSLLGKTFDTNFPTTIYQAIVAKDLKSAIVELTPNLHMIAGGRDMSTYGDFLELEYPYPNNDPISIAETKFKRTFHFSKLLETIKGEYDYIWIDVGPSTDIKVDNAMVAADYFKGEVLGLLPFLLQPKRDLHEEIIASTKETFGENFTFNTIVSNQKRLEDYPEYGISVHDYHDRKIFALFADVFSEIEERISLFETLGDIPEDYIYKPKYLNGNKLTAYSKDLDLSAYEK